MFNRNIKLNKKIKAPLLLSMLLLAFTALASPNLGRKLSGRILLQVESHGQAWYVNPADEKRYYLGRPADAFNLMRNLGIGITNENLFKIPIGLIKYNDNDNDQDGLSNRLENALGTNPEKSDTDNDGYSDKTEIENNYNPLATGTLPIDYHFAAAQKGKIFLAIGRAGEAWYVNPANNKRYYLGRPADAFVIMKNLSLGISNINLNNILIGSLQSTAKPANNQNRTNNENKPQTQTPGAVISGAADAIRAGDTDKVLKYFIPEMGKAIKYTMDFLDANGRLTFGNILSGSQLSSQTETKAIYTNEIYFSLGGYKVKLKFIIKKQPDGSWLLANL